MKLTCYDEANQAEYVAHDDEPAATKKIGVGSANQKADGGGDICHFDEPYRIRRITQCWSEGGLDEGQVWDRPE